MAIAMKPYYMSAHIGTPINIPFPIPHSPILSNNPWRFGFLRIDPRPISFPAKHAEISLALVLKSGLQHPDPTRYIHLYPTRSRNPFESFLLPSPFFLCFDPIRNARHSPRGWNNAAVVRRGYTWILRCSRTLDEYEIYPFHDSNDGCQWGFKWWLDKEEGEGEAHLHGDGDGEGKGSLGSRSTLSQPNPGPGAPPTHADYFIYPSLPQLPPTPFSNSIRKPRPSLGWVETTGGLCGVVLHVLCGAVPPHRYRSHAGPAKHPDMPPRDPDYDNPTPQSNTSTVFTYATHSISPTYPILWFLPIRNPPRGGGCVAWYKNECEFNGFNAFHDGWTVWRRWDNISGWRGVGGGLVVDWLMGYVISVGRKGWGIPAPSPAKHPAQTSFLLSVPRLSTDSEPPPAGGCAQWDIYQRAWVWVWLV